MKTLRVRLALISIAIAFLSGSPLLAQTARIDKPAPSTTRVDPPLERQAPIVRVRSGSVTITEQEFRFSRPIFNLMQDYTLKSGETVRWIRTILANTRIEGRVEGDVVVIMGDATIASTAVIEGSLVVIGGSARVVEGATVENDFVVIGGTADTPPTFGAHGEHVVMGSPMLGDTLRAIVPWLTRGLLLGRLIVPDLGWIWAIVGLSFLVGLLLNHVFARQVTACADTLSRRPLSAFFMGLLVLLLSGPLLAIVAASIVGLAVVPFAIAALIVAGMLGKIGVTRNIGRGIMTERDPGSRFQAWRSYVIGFAVITVAYMIPVLGVLTWAMIGVFGLGTAAMTFAATLRRERPAPVPKAPLPPPSAPEPPSSPFPSTPDPAYGGAASAFSAVAPTASSAVASSSGLDPAAETMVSEGAPPPPPRADLPRPTHAPAAGDWSWYPRASFLDRLAAFALDVVLVAIAAALFRSAFFFRRGGDDGEFMFVVLIYIIAFTAWKGTTLGGIICGLRVVRTNGGELRFVDALVRGLSSIFSVAALGIGCFWMLTDAERQMWHDKIAGTLVVKVPRDLVLA